MDEKLNLKTVVVGLGNPGKKYEYTRHNIGFLVVKKAAHSLGWELNIDKRFNARVVKNQYAGNSLHMILPETYMNESGRTVRSYIDYYKLTPADIIVICDDVELPFGELRLRQKGSSGGHNGLKSIEAYLGTQEYMRLKMGVGKDIQGNTLADYVLDAFKPEEFALLPSFIELGVAALLKLLPK